MGEPEMQDTLFILRSTNDSAKASSKPRAVGIAYLGGIPIRR